MRRELRRIDEHGSELRHAEHFVVSADAGGPVERRSFGAELDSQSNDEKERGRNDETDRSENDIQNAFGEVHGPKFKVTDKTRKLEAREL